MPLRCPPPRLPRASKRSLRDAREDALDNAQQTARNDAQGFQAMSQRCPSDSGLFSFACALDNQGPGRGLPDGLLSPLA
eukprot:1838977-Alexandrium_andersonii.AAC.1